MLLDFPEMIVAGKVWVAEIAGRVAGVLVQYETEAGFYIDTVAALPELQGTGVIHIGGPAQAHALFSRVLHLVKAVRASPAAREPADPGERG